MSVEFLTGLALMSIHTDIASVHLGVYSRFGSYATPRVWGRNSSPCLTLEYFGLGPLLLVAWLPR